MSYKICLMGVALVFAMSSMVQANPLGRSLCGERAKIVDTLENRYAEEAVSMGLSGSGGVVEVFLSEKGSWTIIMTRPTGQSCIMSAGDAWENLSVGEAGDKKISFPN